MTLTLTGDPATIVQYQVIVEEVVGDAQLVINLPASTTELTLPPEFLTPGTEYEFEILAIDDTHNQTITSSEFVTVP